MPECRFNKYNATSKILRGTAREGGLFTIEITEEDRPRRSRANCLLSSGQIVTPITEEWC